MAQSVKCFIIEFAMQGWGPGFDPQIIHKKLGMVLCALIARAGEAETGRSWCSASQQLSLLQASEILVSRKQGGKGLGTNTLD